MCADRTVSGYDTRRSAFLGTYGSKNDPKALLCSHGCTDSDCIAEKICLALENELILSPGETCAIYYTAGVENTLDKIPALSPKQVEEQFAEMKRTFAAICDKVQIQTPWDDLNHLFNDWLKYQTNMGSRWARVRHNGFRDLTQRH